MKVAWFRLLELAQTQVEETLGGLPAPLRAKARRLPVTYEPRPGRALVEEGLAPDTLGLFVGEPLAHEQDGTGGLPAQIFLFLENLWDFSEFDERIFIEEIQTTFMHELGHYLGLDEGDLEARGLD